MKDKLKIAGIGVAVSSVAVLISVISMFIGNFDGGSITIFCCMIAVFCSNIAIYAAAKKNEDEGRNKK